MAETTTAPTALQQQITAKQKEVADKFAIYQAAKTAFVSSKSDWENSVSDLKDLNTQQAALTNGK